MSKEQDDSHIQEIVERLRRIKDTDPDLYREAWDKIPRKTQAAITEYEEHHKSSRSHTSHAHSEHQPSSTLHTSWSKSYEDHHKPSHAHSSARDWEAPEPSITHHSFASKAAATPDQPRPSKHEALSPKIEPEDLESELRESVAKGVPKAHQIMKKAADNPHLPSTVQEVLLATQVYELELIRSALNKLTTQLGKQLSVS